MNIEWIFDALESPAFLIVAGYVCGVILAAFVIWGVLRAAGRGNDGR